MTGLLTDLIDIVNFFTLRILVMILGETKIKCNIVSTVPIYKYIHKTKSKNSAI